MGPVAASAQTSEFRSRNRPAVPTSASLGKPEATGRALVPVAPPKPAAGVCTTLPRPSCAFLAQLIAANRNLPQARARRRAEPHEAIAAYTAAARAA
jgi:hypothetical protein